MSGRCRKCREVVSNTVARLQACQITLQKMEGGIHGLDFAVTAHTEKDGNETIHEPDIGGCLAEAYGVFTSRQFVFVFSRLFWGSGSGFVGVSPDCSCASHSRVCTGLGFVLKTVNNNIWIKPTAACLANASHGRLGIDRLSS